MYVRAVPTTDLNKNTEWFTYPGVWTTYILIVFFSWLIVLSVFGSSPGTSWTIVHLAHSFVSSIFSFSSFNFDSLKLGLLSCVLLNSLSGFQHDLRFLFIDVYLS